jgi:photosystem II stability/assembly factor-like uncharacterized protein
MTTDTERRLRAALEASAELITEPPGTTDYQPPTDDQDGSHPTSTRRRRRGPWVGPLLAAAAVVAVAAGATVIVQTEDTHQGQPISHRSPSPVASSTSPVTSSPSPTPSPTTTPAAGQQPLAGPQVIDAELFAGGHGYVRTQHSLLWTDNLGATWRNVTPPGLTQTQLQTAGIAVQPDGHEWVAVAPKAGSSTVTLLRRASTSQTWTSTSIPLGPLTISSDASVTTSLSFAGADNGWLLVGEQITHTGFGELLRTTDGGASWTLQAGQSTLPAVGTIHFLTGQVGYLDALMTGTWWVTRDAGQSWTRLQLPTPAAKKSDAVNIISAPTAAGDSIVLAASFTTPTQGNDDGVGIYRSTDGGATWTVQQLASETPTEQYNFAAALDGSSYVLLRSQPTQEFGAFTWVASRSTDSGQNFTDTSSVHNFYPGPLSLADPDNLWTLGGANGCKSFKTDCWNTAGLIASNDSGTTWHQVKLPS